MNVLKRVGSKLHGQRGNAIVEFAIIAPFLIGVTLGVIEVGRFAYFGIVVANAARAGASYGALRLETGGDVTGIEAAATSDYGTGFGTLSFPSPPAESCKCWSGTAITGPCAVTASSATCASGTPTYYTTVTVQGSVNALFKIPFLPKKITITKTATMRLQDSLK